jgi:hypothetical protein
VFYVTQHAICNLVSLGQEKGAARCNAYQNTAVQVVIVHAIKACEGAEVQPHSFFTLYRQLNAHPRLSARLEVTNPLLLLAIQPQSFVVQQVA